MATGAAAWKAEESKPRRESQEQSCSIPLRTAFYARVDRRCSLDG